MNNAVLKTFLKVCGITLILLLCEFASFQQIIYPFAIPVALALIGIERKSYIIAPIYFLTSLINSPINEEALIVNGFTSIVLFIIGIAYIKKDSIKWWKGLIYCLICEFGFLYSEIYLKAMYLTGVTSLAVALLTYLCVSYLFKHIKNGFVLFRLSQEDFICICFLLLILSSGVANIPISTVSVYHFIGVLLVLLSAYTLSKTQSVVVSAIYGLGYALNTLQLGYVSLFVCIALAVNCFKPSNKIYSIFIALIIDVLIGMYFKIGVSYDFISLAESVVAGLIFMALPNAFLQYFSGYINKTGYDFGVKTLINRSKDTLQNKLIDLSNIFNEMDIVFRKMTKGVLPVNEAKEMLTRECCQKVCTECPNKAKCFRSKHNMEKIYFDLMTIGFERGRVTLLDIPANLTSFCSRTSQMIMVINQLISEYKQYAGMITDLDTSRLLIADQLNGISQIMKNLSVSIDQDISFDNGKEMAIIGELTNNEIVCNDAIVFQKDNYTTNVNILVRNQDVQNERIKDIVSKVCGTTLEIQDVTPSNLKGWTMINLATTASFDIMFGYAGECKNGETVSGDKFSVLRLNDSKFLMAICDGMGSGELANKTSCLAISLVENFYKAGFDNEIILSSINKLLSINNDENFTALDLCVIDLKNCFADFIKLGAPAGFIKHTDTTTQLNGGALPIGILEEIKPVLYKTVLDNQDMVVLCSDGVVDAFKNSENLKVYINNLDTSHPQKLADSILDKAKLLDLGNVNDDMTVVVGRVYKKY